ncbi:MAG: choice-of-anchor D domain-containing protein, partial [Nocardioidaceae bacterium]
ASAALGRVGAVAGAGALAPGFPTWYADTDGTALQPCLDGLPMCLASAADLMADSGGEGFYFAADAAVGPITVHNAVEAAYAGDGPGQEMVFVRTQVAAHAGGLVPGGTYTVTDPYGTLNSCTANASGQLRNNACRTETVPAAQDFNGALNGRVGPFLTWDTYGDPSLGAPPPAGYIGDNATPHRVTGSPTGFNKVRVVGPGINADGSQPCAADWTGAAADCAETDLFVVQGKVQPGPSAHLSAPSLDFGNTATAATTRLRYTSTGTEPVTVGSVSAGGSADFSLADSCAGTSVAPGTSCTIDVTYTPVAGTTATGSVRVADSTSGSPRTVTLKGSSLPVAGATPRAVGFGTQKAGTTSATETVSVTNDGVAPLHVSTVSLTGAAASQFTADSAACVAAVPVGGSCDVTLAFAPSSNGAKSASLTVRSDGGDLAVALTGTGTTPVVGLSTAAVAFGDVTTGTTGPARAVTLTNSGTAQVTIHDVSISGANAAEFSLGTTTCTVGANIAPHSTCVVQVRHRPVGLGAKTATLSIDADGEVRTVALTGNGVAPVDRTAPRLTGRTPAPNATGVRRGGNVSATFSEPVTGWSAANVTLQRLSAAGRVVQTVPGTLGYNGTTRVGTLNPFGGARTLLAASTRYRVTVKPGVLDTAGNRLTTTSWVFRTGAR